MNNPKIRLLILNDSANEAERLISMLHNAGKQTRAHHVENEQALSKLLQSQSWDLLIGLDSTQNLPITSAVRVIRQHNKDVPIILLTDSEGSRPIVEGIKLGANDVVQLDEDQHLLQAINRELNNRATRSGARFAERRFKEIVRRNQSLLDSSRNGIAFVQDGMFIYTNEAFTALLEYEDRDDLECMPVIDVIEASDQTEIKHFLKDFMVKGSEIDTTQKTIKFLSQNDNVIPVTVDVSKTHYDEEMCLQLLVPNKIPVRTSPPQPAEVAAPEIASQTHEPSTHIDALTSLYTKTYLLSALERALDAALSGEHTGAIICIKIQRFTENVQAKIGMASTDKAITAIAQCAKNITPNGQILCRFSDERFMVLAPKINREEALALAETLCQQLSENIIDIDNTTIHLDFKAGVGLFSEMTTRSDTPITNALIGAELMSGKEHEGKTALLYEPEPDITEENPIGLESDEIIRILQKTIDQGNFNLLFQPILSLRGSDKEHYEIYLRLADDKVSAIPAESFFKVAREHKMSARVDRWVVLEALKVLTKHRTNGHNTVVLVNLTKESMLDETLPNWIAKAFKAAKLPANSVVFQLHENDVNNHLNIAKEFTLKLKELGALCSISHFGCTLNPFKALQHVQVDYVKVDGSFTQELQSNSNEEPSSLGEFVKQLHELDKITVVPFVESASVLSKLWQSGVHYIQGHYLQAPAENMDYDFDSDS